MGIFRKVFILGVVVVALWIGYAFAWPLIHSLLYPNSAVGIQYNPPANANQMGG